MTPAERAQFDSYQIGFMGRLVLTTHSALQAVPREELLSMLPRSVTEDRITKGAVASGEMLLHAIKSYLPTEDEARTAMMDSAERGPTMLSKTWWQLAEARRDWRQAVQTTIQVMDGSSDPHRIFSVVRNLITPFEQHTGLAYQYGQLVDRPTIAQFLYFAGDVFSMALQLSADQRRMDNPPTDATARVAQLNLQDMPAMEDDECDPFFELVAVPPLGDEWPVDSRDSSAAAALGETQEVEASVAKGKGRGTGHRKSSGKGICKEYMTDVGCCSRGGTCWKDHPLTTGKCLRCGSVKHSLAACDRPVPGCHCQGQETNRSRCAACEGFSSCEFINTPSKTSCKQTISAGCQAFTKEGPR